MCCLLYCKHKRGGGAGEEQERGGEGGPQEGKGRGGVEGGGEMEGVRENKGVRKRGLHCTLFTAPKDTLSACGLSLPPPHLLLADDNAPIHHNVIEQKKTAE